MAVALHQVARASAADRAEHGLAVVDPGQVTGPHRSY
jgi:hypothetical protein